MLIGVIIGTLVPVQAHGRHVPDRRLATLEHRVARLEARTRHMTAAGYVHANYVSTTRCQGGDPAVWQSFTANVRILAC